MLYFPNYQEIPNRQINPNPLKQWQVLNQNVPVTRPFNPKKSPGPLTQSLLPSTVQHSLDKLLWNEFLVPASSCVRKESGKEKRKNNETFSYEPCTHLFRAQRRYSILHSSHPLTTSPLINKFPRNTLSSELLLQ